MAEKRVGSKDLLADAEFLNNGFVPFGVVLLEVVEQTTTLADHHEKPAPRGVVLLVRFEMVRQLADALTQYGDLDLRAAGVRIMRAVLLDDGLFLLSR